ncbi:MAG: SDR family oxidoreductase [Chloroflexota bacterium]|nr:SDR family oxidoreductase [Chloroflexota bacterium]
MPDALSGAAAVVTGAGRGIGRAIALALAAEGATVFAVARTREALDRVAGEARASGATVVPVPCDVSLERDVRRVADAVAGRFPALRVLVNAAALRMHQLGDPDALRVPVLELSVEDWDRVVAVDLRGPFLCCRYLGPLLAAAGGAGVVNISAGAAVRPDAGRAPYAASKAGLDALTRTLALEWRDARVAVNSLDPGAHVITEDHRAGTRAKEAGLRYVTPEAMVPPTLYLAQGAVTGQRVDAMAWNEANGFGGFDRWEAR